MRAPTAADHGDTLVEVLLTTVIVGIGVAGILGGIGAGVSLSSVQHDRTVAEAAVREYAEAVQATQFKPCAEAPAAYSLASVGGLTALPATVDCVSDVLQIVRVGVRSADPRVGVSSLEVAKPRLP